MVVNHNKPGGKIPPMTIIRQPSLFSIQELNDMESTQKYETIISAINMDTIYNEINKKPTWCAYRA